MKAPLRILAFVVVSAALAACAQEQTAPSGPLLTVIWRGGLCSYGACAATFELSADGAYSLAEGDGTETSGAIDSALVDGLSDAVERADFGAVRVRSFTETCPTAYDGQEIIYTFRHHGGDERMSTCKYVLEWDLPQFPQLLAILDAVQP